MTNENVILILEQIRTHYDGTCKEALDIAISALSENKGDLISRQAVLNLKQTFTDNAGYETEYVDIEDIKELPPVEDKGEWNVSHTDIDELWATCSNCDEEVKMRLTDDYTPIFYNFCPNCGADMRGGVKSFYDRMTEELGEDWDVPADMKGGE